MAEATMPLPLPDGFDPEVNLVARVTEGGVFHESRRGARLAQQLVANGTPQDLALMGITTYHSPSFALGVSAKEAGGQSNSMMVHYFRPGADRAGVMYTRYLVDDKWLGDFYHATDRTRSRNLIEEGRFYGVQQGSRAIGLYAPRRLDAVFSAKASLIWTRCDLVDEIWFGDRRVDADQLPVEVPPGKVIVLGSGDALFAVLPLTRNDLGRDAPVRLAEAQGDLVLELYNYLGPQKRFWELNWPGAFFKGTPQCGFYLEVAERAAYPDGRAFAETVASGTVVDDTAAPFVYAGGGERLWTVEYVREGESLGIEVEAMGTGTVVWDDGVVTLEAVGLQGTPQVSGGQLAP
jgi:hypothetical protein